LSSEQQGPVEREKTYNDSKKQNIFIGVNIVNVCSGGKILVLLTTKRSLVAWAGKCAKMSVGCGDFYN
jgi:hypothetical protein